MARVLGAEGYPFVTTDHPISSATDHELYERAKVAVAHSASLLLGS
ncbi:MAG: hypothetical protein ACI915_004426 [Gammaproteobacteria bacterium]|jgi:hypothetical protein